MFESALPCTIHPGQTFSDVDTKHSLNNFIVCELCLEHCKKCAQRERWMNMAIGCTYNIIKI